MKFARGLLPALFLPALCAAFPFPGSYYLPASSPTLLKATNVGTAGGNVTITSGGATFDSPSVQFIASGSNGPWLMCGVGSTCTVVSTSTSQVVVNFPATTCGTSTCNYDALLCNRDGSCVFSSQLLTVTSSSTPSTILTTRLVGWLDANHDANSGCGASTTGVTDRSSSGNAPTSLTAITHNCISPHTCSGVPCFNGQPTWSCNGTSSSMIVPSFALGAGIHTVWMMMAVRLNSAGTNPRLWTDISPALIGNVSTGIPNTQLNGNAIWTSSIIGTVVSIESYALGLTSTTETLGISVNGQPTITTGGTGTWTSTGGPMAWCSDISGGSPASPYADEEIAEVIVANAVPTNSEKLQLAEYLNLKYQIAPAPHYVAATNVRSTSAGAQSWRMTGANLVSGMNAVVSHANVSIGTVTTTILSSTLAEMSLPSATYTAQLDDIDLLNPDGGEETTLNGINVTATADPMTICGVGNVGWWSGDHVIPSSGNVGTYSDASFRGNEIATNTATVYTAVDSTFANHGSGTYDGSTSFGSLSSLAGVSAADPVFFWATFKLTAQTGNALFFDYGGTSELRFNQAVAGHPGINFGGTATQWASALTTAGVHYCYIYATGASPWTQAINCDSGSTGTEVTSSVTNTPVSAAAAIFVGKRAGGNFLQGKLAEFGVCRGVALTPTQISDMHVHAQTLGAP